MGEGNLYAGAVVNSRGLLRVWIRNFDLYMAANDEHLRKRISDTLVSRNSVLKSPHLGYQSAGWGAGFMADIMRRSIIFSSMPTPAPGRPKNYYVRTACHYSSYWHWAYQEIRYGRSGEFRDEDRAELAKVLLWGQDRRTAAHPSVRVYMDTNMQIAEEGFGKLRSVLGLRAGDGCG